MKPFKNLPIKIKLILVIQSMAMLMGTSTHLVWLLRNGVLSEKYHAPLPSMLFWDSLTLLDPLAALLLFIKPKAGLVLTLIIITLDVIHNNTYYFDELYMQGVGLAEWLEKYWMILGQILFAVFVLFTFRSNLRNVNAT